MDIEELKRLHADFPEINLSNFDVDDVAALNGWGIEVVLMLPAILAKLEAAQRLRDVADEARSWMTMPKAEGTLKPTLANVGANQRRIVAELQSAIAAMIAAKEPR